MAEDMSIKIVHKNGGSFVGATRSILIQKDNKRLVYEIDGTSFFDDELTYLKIGDIAFIDRRGDSIGEAQN